MKKVVLSFIGFILLIFLAFLLLAFIEGQRRARFSRIFSGASMGQVLTIVGSPESVTTNTDGGYYVRWRYPEGWPSRGFTTVFFSTNGVYRIYAP
jgi:hypothetical protein